MTTQAWHRLVRLINPPFQPDESLLYLFFFHSTLPYPKLPVEKKAQLDGILFF